MEDATTLSWSSAAVSSFVSRDVWIDFLNFDLVSVQFLKKNSDLVQNELGLVWFEKLHIIVIYNS